MSLAQKKRSSANLHAAIKQSGLATNILECSRAGNCDLGVQLSAFNLPYYEDNNMSVETVYQGSKVFQHNETGEVVWLNHL